MPRQHLGNRKQIAIRIPTELFDAVEARRAQLGLTQTEAIIIALRSWLRPPDPEPHPAAPKPRKPSSGKVAVARAKRTVVTKTDRRIRGFDPISGKPIYG